MNFWEELHAAITTILKREIPEIKTCESYPVIKTALLAPAVLVELATFEPGNDPGTGEIALRARFEARVIVDSTIPNAAFAVRALASEVARVVHQNSWGMNVSPAEFLGASPDGFKPDLDAYMVWIVEWAHELHRGDSVWTPSGIQPHTVYVGIAPEIGDAHETKYVEVQHGEF